MKRKFITAIVAAALCVCAVVGLTACNNAPDKGYDIEMAKAAGEYLNIEVKFEKINWDSKETELNGKSIDLIWNGLTINDERLETMQISTPYMRNSQVAVIRKDDIQKYKTREDMASAKLVAEKGSAGADVIKSDFPSAPSVSALDQATCLTEVASKTSDVAIIDSVMAKYYTTSTESTFSSKLTVVEDLIFSEEQYGIAARKGELGTIYKINEALAALQKDGTMKKISDKYGLTSEVLDCSFGGSYDSLSAEQKKGWEDIVAKGKLVIGYTLYAPIAYK